MSPANRPSHKHLMTRLLSSGNYSDFTIVCSERTFKVHQAIVSERCDFFARCFRHPCKESGEMTVLLPKDDPDAVHGMLYYLYTLCYPKDLKDSLNRSLLANPTATPEYFAHLGHHYWLYDLELFKTAHKHGLDYLAKLAKEQIDIRAANPDPELFLARVSGYVTLVEHIYHTSLQQPNKTSENENFTEEGNATATRALQEAKEESEMYVDQLQHTRRLLLESTATLVAKHIKNERLDRLTQTNAQFRQDLCRTLERQHATALQQRSALLRQTWQMDGSGGW